MSKSAVILKNTLANYVQQAAAVGVFLFLTPFAARQLGTEQFGLWSLMWSMVGVLGLVDMGVSSAVVKFIADARGNQDGDRSRHLYSTFFWVQTTLALVVLLSAVAITPVLRHIFIIPDSLQRTASIVFGVLSFRVATGMPFGLFVGLLAGHRKQAYSSIIKTFSILTYGVFVFFMLNYSPTAISLAISNIIIHLLSNAVIIAVACRTVPDFTIRPALFSRSLVKEISLFSGAAFMVQISSLLYTRVDIFIVQRFLSLTNVAHYTVAMQTISRGALFCKQMTSALTPLIAEMKGANDAQSIRLILRKGTKLNTALTTPLMGGLIWLASDLIQSWMGPEFAESVLPMRLLAGVAWISAICGVSSTVLTMTGYQKREAILTVTGQIMNVALTLLLVRRFGLGGVAFASLVSGLSIGIMTIWFTVRLLKLSFRHTYGPILASLFPLVIMLGSLAGMQWTVRTLGIQEPTLLHVAVEEALGSVIFFVAFYLFGCSAKERDYYLSKILAVLSRLKRKK